MKPLFDRKGNELSTGTVGASIACSVIDGELRIDGHEGRVRISPNSRGKVIDEMMYLWASLSTLPPARNIEGYIPLQLKPLVERIWKRYGQKPPEVTFNASHIEPGATPEGNRAIVAMSGGFDSTGVALKLIEEGYEVHGFTIDGLNKSAYNYPEMRAVREICERIEIPLIERKIVNSLKSNHVENPIKNLLISAMMMIEAQRIGASVIGTGVFEEDQLQDVYCPSDAGSVLQEYHSYLATALFPHGLRFALPNVETEQLLHKYCITSDVRSCMTVYRNMKQVRRAFSREFPIIDIEVRPEFCGRCYKCCGQALISMELGTRRYGTAEVEDRFRVHCEKVLAKWILKNSREGIYPTAYDRDYEWAKRITGK